MMTVLNAIKSYWDYQKADRPAGHIGMSSIGMCARRLAYQKHQVVGMPLDWRAKIIFDDGNLHHDQIRKAIREGLVMTEPCFSLIREEEEVKLGILTGHIDGVLQHDHTACNKAEHRTMLLEVKSINERGFAELKSSGILSKEYRAQTTAYLRATGLHSAVVLVKNKNTGEMLSLIYEGNPVLLDERLSVLFTVQTSEKPEDVDREYQPDDKGQLKFPCTYCPYTLDCWKHLGVVKQDVHRFAVIIKTVTSDKKRNTKMLDDDGKPAKSAMKRGV